MALHRGQYTQYIFEKLRARVRVAVEVDGYQSNSTDAVNTFDSYRDADALQDFEKFAASVERQILNTLGPTQATANGTRKQIGIIDAELRKYADALTQNAHRGDVDLEKVEDSQFNKMARIFEDRHKSKLVIVSPFWHY